MAPRDQPIAIVPRLYPGSLGVIRSLAKSGVSVIAVDNNKSSEAFATRMADKLFFGNGGKSFVDALLAWAGRWQERPVLFLTDDKDLLEVSARREELETHYRFALPDRATLELLMNKRLFAEYAKNKGLCIPITHSVPDLKAVQSVAEKITYPCVLKPHLKKSSKHLSAEELVAAYEALCPSERDVIVQEQIPGGDDKLYFCFLYFDHQTRLKAQFSARKVRQWPPEVGLTSFAESVTRKDLLEMSVELFRDLEYWGYGAVEYKEDSRDGSFKVMEPTVGRFDLQIALATACGVNFPYRMYCDLLGRPLPVNSAQRDGVKWIYEPHELLAFRELRRQKKLGWLKWLWSLRGAKTFVLWDYRDPGPMYVFIKITLRRLAVKLVGLLGRKKPSQVGESNDILG